MLHKSMHTTWTASRQAGVAPASQYAASSAVRPFHLAQQALLTVQVEEAGVPPVREQAVLPGLLIDGEAGPAAAVLIDPQVRHRRGIPLQQRIGPRRERLMRRGQEIPACRAASAGVIPRQATSCAACSRSRAVSRHRGGTDGTHSVNVLRGHSRFSRFRRTLTHRRSTTSPARRTSRGRVTTISCTRPDTVPQPGHAAAAG